MWALERRQGLARSLRSRDGWRLECSLERRQGKARSLRSRAGWRLEGALECRQWIARSLRSRAGWRLEGALERRHTRTKQHCRHRYRLSPISTAADVCKSRLIRYTNETTPTPPISTVSDIDGVGYGDIEAHQAHERFDLH